jgi:hypothetical protein
MRIRIRMRIASGPPSLRALASKLLSLWYLQRIRIRMRYACTHVYAIARRVCVCVCAC